ncbi:MAG: hypothetical protein WC476_11685 [Phycisphaerae bacterium]|jgi:hypothetical protein
MKKDYVREVAEAHSNLSIWAAIQVLLESSLLCGGHHEKAEARIIKIVKAEQQKELRRYDKAQSRLR